jgi:ketosteroid isomerase-like protein
MNVTRSQAQIALAILGAVAAALLLNRFIVTDKKRIERSVEEMADAATKGDVDALFSHVSEDYRDDIQTRAELQSRVADFFRRFHQVDAKIQGVTVNVAGTLAHVEISVSGSVGSGETRMPMGTSEWSAEFRKEADGTWRATSIAPVRIWGHYVSGWRDLP